MSPINEKQQKILRRSLAAVILLAVLLPFLWWQRTAITTTAFSTESAQLPAAFHGFRILQVSDLHNTAYGENQSELLRMTREADPDLIALTGDFLDYTDIENCMDFARGAVGIAPTFFVPGNQETYYPDAYARLRESLLSAGVQVLEDESVELWRGGASVRLIGMRDPAFSAKEGVSEPNIQFASRLSALCPRDEYTILLSHRPELAETYDKQGVDLALTGHAHGGLVRLPFVGAIAALDQGFLPKYTAGIQTVGETSLVVSRGAGNGAASFFRLGNRPELVLVTLYSRQVPPVRFTAA